MTAIKVILIVLCAFFLWQVLIRAIRKLYRFPAPAFIGRFLDSDLRRWRQPPDKLIERSGIKPGMTVMDLGCGSGAFTPFVARAVGEQGKVYAVDIQPAMLRQLEGKLAKAENQDIKNIELRQAGAYELPFEDRFLDLVYMITVLPEIPDRGRALREIKRVLKPGGILAVTELLPDPDYPLRSTTIKLCRREGFVLDSNSGNLWNYTVRFKKPVV
ncbi:2-methoxy-6-polyprenyl-1,4-benzoquinol methylase, mitochondrial [subsurface metagenome]